MYEREEHDFSSYLTTIPNSANLVPLIGALSANEIEILIEQLCKNEGFVNKFFQNDSIIFDIFPYIKNHEKNEKLCNKILQVALSDMCFLKILNSSQVLLEFITKLNQIKNDTDFTFLDVDTYLVKIEKKLIELDEVLFHEIFMCAQFERKMFIANPNSIKGSLEEAVAPFDKSAQAALLKAIPTILESREIHHSKEEVIEKSRIMAQARRYQGTFFNKLPDDVLPQIAKHTRTSSKHTEEDAEETAKSNLNKPIRTPKL